MEIPTPEEAAARVKAGTATTLDELVHYYAPSRLEAAKDFRELLKRVVDEPRQPIDCIPDPHTPVMLIRDTAQERG